MARYTDIRENDFSGGEDARSAETQIPERHVLEALNVDILERRLPGRKGYQGYAGNFPVRVVSTDYDSVAGEICFKFDTSVNLAGGIDLAAVASKPIVVYGHNSAASSGNGPFTGSTSVGKYYSGFFQKIRKTFGLGTGSVTILGSEHGLSSSNLFIELTQSLSAIQLDNRVLLWEEITVNTVTFDVTVTYTNNSGSAIQVFVYMANESTVNGSSYVSSTTTIPSSASPQFLPTITAGTHQLGNFNIVPQVFSVSGTTRRRVKPESLSVNQSTGAVDISVVNNTGSSINYMVILAAAPATQASFGNITSGSTSTVTISNPTKAFIFPGIYLQNGTSIELVIPDDIEYSSTTNTTSVTFTNNESVARLFRVFWIYGTVQSTEVCVSDATVTVSGTDSRPQLTIWGLDHSEIYGGVDFDRAGWSNHIDSYKRPGEARVVAGLGGNLFTARDITEVSSDYLYGSAFPDLSVRVATQRIAPTFWETGDTPGRTRGYITGGGLGDNWATARSISWDSGVGAVKYSCTIPSLALLDANGNPGTLSNIFNTNDYITVEQAGYVKQNGTYKVVQAQVTGNVLDIWATNSNIDSSDYNDSGCAALVGVFTDRVESQTATPFLVDDLLESDLFGNDSIITVVGLDSSNPLYTYVSGVVSIQDIAAGLQIVGRRTSSIIPLRDANGSSLVENFVIGDMVSYSPIVRNLRIVGINASSDIIVGLISDGTTATVTLGSGDTSSFPIGAKLLLRNAGVYTGHIQVASVPSTTTLTFASTETATVTSATLVGNTIQVDEELKWVDSVDESIAITAGMRLIPLEAPGGTGSLIQDTYVQHFDASSYTNQDFLRSNVINSSMYLTNGLDEVMKFDGSNLYRSGLPNWQPGFLLTQDTAVPGIETDLRTVAYTARSASLGRLTVATGDELTLPIGTSIYLSGDSVIYTIQGIDTINHFIFVDRALASGVTATGSLKEVAVYRYYYRLNMVDANNNIIASAVSQSEDYVIELDSDAAVYHKLLSMPAFDNYDYDRLEVEIYRTKKNQVAPFYKIETISLRDKFNADNGYIEYTDKYSDRSLFDLDVVSTALEGQELGRNWSEPLRAENVTTAANSLVLSNVREYPQLDIVLRNNADTVANSFDNNNILFRKDNTDTGTTTDAVNRMVYQWRAATHSLTVTGITGVTGTSFQVTTSTPHGFTVAGQWAYLYYPAVATSNQPLTYSGHWMVSSVDSGTTFTMNYAYATAGAATFFPTKMAVCSLRDDVPVLIDTDGNLGMSNGNTDKLKTANNRASRRLAAAINSTMRSVDTSITSMSTFRPWMSARGGGDTGLTGRLIVRQPSDSVNTIEITSPSYAGFDIYVNDISLKNAAGVIQQRSAATRLYPSRLLVSYENYSEIFDNPTAVLDNDSKSAIDVNPSDGQEIVCSIPFFGEAAFGAAQQSNVVVVFKKNSVYLVDIAEKRAGRAAVQRIETEGIGCSAPNSVAVTKNGIIFANESGMYCLRRNLKVEYLGKLEERNWLEETNRNLLEIMQGHHYTEGRQYKLSVPVSAATKNSLVFVYHHTSEDTSQTGVGGWTRYDSHPATGWANLLSDAFFGTSTGRVMIIRNTGEVPDYRDDSSAIQKSVKTRPNDFGVMGVRKTLDSFVVNYRAISGAQTVEVATAVNTEDEYLATTPVTVRGTVDRNGIADAVQKKVDTVRHNTSRRQGVYHSLQFTHVTIDGSFELAGIDYKVATKGTGQGIAQAAGTK